MFRDKKSLILILGIFLISSVSALNIIAGDNYTFSVDITDPLFWDVTGNSSNMEGFEVYQDIYDSYSNITFAVDYRFKPDTFTIILFSNKTKEIVKEVPIYRGGGGGEVRKVYVENKTIEYVNKTIKDEEEIKKLNDDIKKLQDELSKKNKFIIISTLILLIFIIISFNLLIKNKKK